MPKTRSSATSSPATPCMPPWPARPDLVIGYLHDRFIHVPIELLTSREKRMDPDGFAWSAVLAATGQPAKFE